MQHFTLFETKQLAAYLKTSISLVPQHSPALKHGQCLNALASSCSYRDWNAMSAIAPELPETEWGKWYQAFFAVARVILQSGETSDHFIGYRDEESNRSSAGKALAKSVLAKTGLTLHGKKFKYSRPDGPELKIEIASIERARKWSRHPWNDEAPLVLRSTDSQVTVLLWWLCETYTMATNLSRPDGFFSYHSLSFCDAGRTPYMWVGTSRPIESLTDRFIFDLTGVMPTKRDCLYITELPNGPNESYIPVQLREGEDKPVLLEQNFGMDRWEALERVQVINFSKGVTVNDRETISQIFRQHEPHEEELPIDFSWQSED